MTNNEKFNQMLNSCQHPRRVYNALTALAEAPQPEKPNIQKLTDYINQQPDPERFMMALLTVAAKERPLVSARQD